MFLKPGHHSNITFLSLEKYHQRKFECIHDYITNVWVYKLSRRVLEIFLFKMALDFRAEAEELFRILGTLRMKLLHLIKLNSDLSLKIIMIHSCTGVKLILCYSYVVNFLHIIYNIDYNEIIIDIICLKNTITSYSLHKLFKCFW